MNDNALQTLRKYSKARAQQIDFQYKEPTPVKPSNTA